MRKLKIDLKKYWKKNNKFYILSIINYKWIFYLFLFNTFWKYYKLYDYIKRNYILNAK